MITHFREAKYWQPVGTFEDLSGGLGDGHFSISPTFLHHLGSTRWTSMTKLSHHYSSKGQERGNTATHPKWQCHPGWAPGMHLLSTFPCPTPHSHTAQLCWGCPSPDSPGTHPRPEIRRQKRKNPYPWTKEERNAKAALIASDMMRHCFLPSLSARPPSKTAPTIIPR